MCDSDDRAGSHGPNLLIVWERSFMTDDRFVKHQKQLAQSIIRGLSLVSTLLPVSLILLDRKCLGIQRRSRSYQGAMPG